MLNTKQIIEEEIKNDYRNGDFEELEKEIKKKVAKQKHENNI